MEVTNREWFSKACEMWRERMTPKRQKLFDIMVSKIGNGWEFVPTVGFTIRWDRELPTPDFYREPHYGLSPIWRDPTYDQHVFLTLVTPTSNPILKVWHAPWVPRQDTDITLKRAFEVLNDPASVLDR